MSDIVGRAGIAHILPLYVQFLGAVTASDCQAIVTELASRGDLQNVLSVLPRGNLKDARLIKMATDIARGMLYLHSLDPLIIHRDLTAKVSSYLAAIICSSRPEMPWPETLTERNRRDLTAKVRMYTGHLFT